MYAVSKAISTTRDEVQRPESFPRSLGWPRIIESRNLADMNNTSGKQGLITSSIFVPFFFAERLHGMTIDKEVMLL